MISARWPKRQQLYGLGQTVLTSYRRLIHRIYERPCTIKIILKHNREMLKKMRVHRLCSNTWRRCLASITCFGNKRLSHVHYWRWHFGRDPCLVPRHCIPIRFRFPWHRPTSHILHIHHACLTYNHFEEFPDNFCNASLIVDNASGYVVCRRTFNLAGGCFGPAALQWKQRKVKRRP